MNTLPRGPRSTLLQLSMLLPFKDPLDSVAQTARKYADPMTIPTIDGPLVVTWDPEGIKAIFSADPDIYAPTAPDGVEPFLGEGSLFRMEGARHRRARKLLAPPFHGERMRAYGMIMRDVALRWMSGWEVDKPFPILDALQKITLDVIIEAVFGVQGGERVRRFHDDIVDAVTAFSPAIVLLKFIRHEFLGLGPWANFQRRFGRLKAIVSEEMEAHRASPQGRVDILSLLLTARDEDGQGLTDQEIHDQLMTLVMAGNETTAISLAWACYCLLTHPEALSRLKADIAALGKDADPDEITRLPYLQAVCEESLRLYPITPFVNRKLNRPFTLKGYDLPAGVSVSAGTYLAHLREEVFPEPLQFKPERFLDRTYSPFEYMPFGGGSRRCLGAAFAMYEMKIVLATLFSRYRLKLAEQAPVKPTLRAVTIGPRGGVRVVLEGPAE